ncbi:MAG: hypothetical protein QM723_32785 [Myxococcaceae bacterium]
MSLEKDPAVHALIERAQAAFPDGMLEICDHWDGDLSSIGFVRAGDDSRLLWVLARPDSDGYAVVREYGASIDDQRNVEVGERCSLEQVLTELAAHLDLTVRS